MSDDEAKTEPEHPPGWEPSPTGLRCSLELLGHVRMFATVCAVPGVPGLLYVVPLSGPDPFYIGPGSIYRMRPGWPPPEPTEAERARACIFTAHADYACGPDCIMGLPTAPPPDLPF